MKKTILLVFSVLSLSVIKASDTLAIRQVFNYSIGDTFEYRQIQFNQCSGMYINTYMKRVVTGKSYNTTLDTVYYQYDLSFYGPYQFSGNQLFPVSSYDTIGSLDSPDITLTGGLPGGCGSAVRDSSFYFDHTSDSFDITCFESRHTIVYTERLGLTYYNMIGGGDPCGNNGNQYKLIHFGNDSMRYDAPLGLSDPGTATYQGLYPNPAADKVYVTLPSTGATGSYLVITDLFARTAYRSDILSDQNPIDISTLSSGLYLWRIESDHGTIQTGKIVKQ